MKSLKSLYFALAAMCIPMAGLLSSCQAEMNEPAQNPPVATLKANISIAELKDLVVNDPTQIYGENYVSAIQTAVTPDGDVIFLDTKTDLIPQVGTRPGTDEHYVIAGRVISSDASGNIYKSISIQDKTGAITFSVNNRSLFNEYRLGQEVVFDLTGTYVGFYSGLLQVGWLGTPYGGQQQIDRMSWDIWTSHSQLNGDPNNDFIKINEGDPYPDGKDNPYYVVLDLAKGLPAAETEDFYKLQCQLVEIRNVYFEDGGKEPYAVKDESVNRTLKGVNGGEIIVRNSGYSNFYNQMLPEGTGTVRGILGFYGSDWQLTLRDITDVIITQKGDEDMPYTVTEALDAANAGQTGWTTGFVVGSVRSGVKTVTGNADIIFGADAELDNNLVIAADANVKDWTKCVVVELPQGTDLRKYTNLADNPAMLGRELTLTGTIGKFLGMTAITGCPGALTDFKVDGVNYDPSVPVIPPTPGVDPKGSGTEADPYNTAAIAAATADTKGVWVEAYVAGYVAQNTWDTAVFNATQTEGSTNYLNNTNVVLSDVESGWSRSNSIPATLKAGVKDTLGLQRNPGILGKKVLVKGDINSDIYGTRGLKNISDVRVL